MKRAPNWTAEEFEQLLNNPQLSDEALAATLERRSAGAVGVVRSGIHGYHRGLESANSLLSKMMRDRLEGGPDVTCPLCRETV